MLKLLVSAVDSHREWPRQGLALPAACSLDRQPRSHRSNTTSRLKREVVFNGFAAAGRDYMQLVTLIPGAPFR